jgi:hypothetical protein
MVQIGKQNYPYDDIRDILYPEALIGIDVSHHRVHDGRGFHYAQRQNIGVGAAYDFLFVAPTTISGKMAHVEISISADAKGYVTLFEDATTSNDGTPLTIRNRNRISANTPSSTMFSAPTVTGTGNQLTIDVFGSGEKAGGSTRDKEEFVINSGKKYLIRINAVNVMDCAIHFDWYEI